MIKKEHEKTVIPLCVGMVISIIVLTLIIVIPSYDLDLPHNESTNADTAYEWFIETNNITYNYPSCSLQARHWIDEYRNHNNLTHIQFPCAIWLNDMSDWFYY